jgi:hypothetical protein
MQDLVENDCRENRDNGQGLCLVGLGKKSPPLMINGLLMDWIAHNVMKAVSSLRLNGAFSAATVSPSRKGASLLHSARKAGS